MTDLKRRLRTLETGDTSGLREYPTDDRQHADKLIDLRDRHGAQARFRLPCGDHRDIVDLFV